MEQNIAKKGKSSQNEAIFSIKSTTSQIIALINADCSTQLNSIEYVL